jgi:hypothetical protein
VDTVLAEQLPAGAAGPAVARGWGSPGVAAVAAISTALPPLPPINPLSPPAPPAPPLPISPALPPPYRVLCNKVDGRAAGMRDDAFRMLDAQGIHRFRASTRLLSAHAYAPAQGLVVTQYPKDRYSIEAASEYRAVALEMFADWRTPIGRHTPLAVAARTEGGH